MYLNASDKIPYLVSTACFKATVFFIYFICCCLGASLVLSGLSVGENFAFLPGKNCGVFLEWEGKN